MERPPNPIFGLTPNKSAQTLGSNLLNTGNAGSATGNPRNKCALKPGFSLMGWVRLGNSGEDLAGTGGRITPVSTTELAKHNKRDDAWMAIRGKVYNVTRYMDYHPGGDKELMRGVGRDATLLFNEVHAWVNYQQLLAKCYIGPLRTVVKIEESLLEIVGDMSKQSAKSDGAELRPPLRPPSSRSAEIVPRFDWIQKRDELTLYVYTRTNSNPGLLLRRLNDKNLHVRIQIEQVTHLLNLELQQAVQWPPRSVKVAAGETGKIEMCLTKTTPGELWSAYGTHTFSKCNPTQITPEDEALDFELVEKEGFNHDSFTMRLRSSDALIWLPIGYHLSILAPINGDTIERSYTPVPVKFLPKLQTSNAVTPLDLHFLIKSYANGKVSTHLQQLQVGGSVQLSPPHGNFKLDALLPHRRFAFLAAGSGLTPFLSVIEQLLRRNTNRIEHLQLYYFNKTEADIWCRDSLERLQVDDERFCLTNVLSQPSIDWTGHTGRVSKDLLAPLLDKNNEQHATYVAICGPTAFNQLASELLLQTLQFNAAHLDIFQA